MVAIIPGKNNFNLHSPARYSGLKSVKNKIRKCSSQQLLIGKNTSIFYGRCERQISCVHMQVNNPFQKWNKHQRIHYRFWHSGKRAKGRSEEHTSELQSQSK